MELRSAEVVLLSEESADVIGLGNQRAQVCREQRRQRGPVCAACPDWPLTGHSNVVTSV
jgi:hypothetical protein